MPVGVYYLLKSHIKEKEKLMPSNQTQHCSGVGKGMQMMQYSWPDTYNAVRDLARLMPVAMQVHFDAMLMMMKYVGDTSDRGLVLNLTQKWNGNKEDNIVISGRSDYNYTKDMQIGKSISQYRVLLEGAPVMFKKSKQKSVSRVLCAQGRLYVWNVLKLMGLKVKLPMILKMDNKGAVDLANIGVLVVAAGMLLYTSVQCFLWDLRSPG